jgi:hypothetical protein
MSELKTLKKEALPLYETWDQFVVEKAVRIKRGILNYLQCPCNSSKQASVFQPTWDSGF